MRQFAVYLLILATLASVTGIVLAQSGATHNTPLSVRMPDHGEVVAVKSLEDFIRVQNSAGALSGFGITTDDDNDQITVAAGDAMLRETDSDTAKFYMVRIPETTLDVATDLTQYVIANYNSGSPRVEIVTDLTAVPCQARCALAVISEAHGKIHVLEIGAYHADFFAKHARKLAVSRWLERGIGAKVTDAGTRQFTVSAAIWYLVNNIFPVAAVDTSGAGVFRAFWRDGSGGWTSSADLQTIPNDKYDDGDGTLGNIPNNAYANFWLFQVIDNPNGLGAMYPQATHNQLAGAQAESLPDARPPTFDSYSVGTPIARITVQQANAEIVEITQPFTDELLFE